MKCLSLQIQLNIDNAYQVEDAIRVSRALGRFPEVDRGDEQGKEQTGHVSLNYFSENVAFLWRDLQQGLLGNPEIGTWLKKVAIVACEGESGWDDYLLLYHFDAAENIDSL